MRKNSYAFCGGAFGDEGKGKIVDEYVNLLSSSKEVIVYRDNGGANAGHTIELENGKRLALHQLPSGVVSKIATVVLGKGMVIHPGDLLGEIQQVKTLVGEEHGTVMIDEMAVLSLDTHRAFESVLVKWQTGYGATGRGISPAYADIIYRHPLRASDLTVFNKEKIAKHYQLYQALITGLGGDIANTLVPTGEGSTIPVGSEVDFIVRLLEQSKELQQYIKPVDTFLRSKWEDESIPFIFEKAQAIGLDTRWGVYPDITASDTTFAGILHSTEGIINPMDIDVRAAVIKATYMSTVGFRVLPTMMEEKLASHIREDAHEYGATTKRPRGLAYLDMPMLKFFARVGDVNSYVITHMDIVYPGVPIKVCTGYTKDGKPVDYRPDQEYLHTVTPVYKEFAPWSSENIRKAKTMNDLPKEAKEYLAFIEESVGQKIIMITTGPKRNEYLKLS
jgi:adenylosuccinate synthase